MATLGSKIKGCHSYQNLQSFRNFERGGAQWSAFFKMAQILKKISPKWALLTKIIKKNN
jgi:hypothetical protein